MFDALTILAIAGTFLIAGTVKGVIGLGLPTVSLALLTVAAGLGDVHLDKALWKTNQQTDRPALRLRPR